MGCNESSEFGHPLGWLHFVVIAVTILFEIFALMAVTKKSKLMHHMFLIVFIIIASSCNLIYLLIQDCASDPQNVFLYIFFFFTNFTMLAVLWHLAITYWKVASEIPKVLLGVDRDPAAHRFLVVNVLGYGITIGYSIWATINYSKQGIYSAGYYGLLVTKLAFIILFIDGVRLNMHSVEAMVRRPLDYMEIILHALFSLLILTALIMDCFIKGPQDGSNAYISSYCIVAVAIWILMWIQVSQANMYKITKNPHIANGVDVIQYQVYCNRKVIYRWQVVPQQQLIEHMVLDKDGREAKEVVNGEETVHLTNEMRTAVCIFFGFVSKRALPPVDRAVTATVDVDMTRAEPSMTYAAPNRTNMTANNPQAQSMMRNQTAAMVTMDATAMAQNNMTANTGNFGGQTMMQMQQPIEVSVSPSNVTRQMAVSPMNQTQQANVIKFSDNSIAPVQQNQANMTAMVNPAQQPLLSQTTMTQSQM